jgi:hypothetical protein
MGDSYAIYVCGIESSKIYLFDFVEKIIVDF